ncbi:MAG: GNAT family N-acetyltransferase [Spirochaetales bacterium]|nr:GNAT family N-acetyltransferase [Spirochaetales bacterium]
MGNVGAFDFNWNNETCEIGYWILGQFEGKGYMSEAVAVLEKALFETGFHRIIIRCDEENILSGNIPRRLGYTREGTMRDCYKIEVRYVSHEVHSKLSHEA